MTENITGPHGLPESKRDDVIRVSPCEIASPGQVTDGLTTDDAIGFLLASSGVTPEAGEDEDGEPDADDGSDIPMQHELADDERYPLSMLDPYADDYRG